MNRNVFFEKYNLQKGKKFQSFQNYLKQKSKKEYKDILKLFSKILNNYHGINLTSKNWNYIIGPWLKYILDIIKHKELIAVVPFSEFLASVSNTLYIIDFLEIPTNRGSSKV